VDAAVQHKPLQGEPGDLATDRIEAGKQHRLRRVVDDEVDSGDGLEGPDIAALPADDAALHLVPGQMQHRDHGLAGLLGRHPLDGQRDDLARSLVAFGPGLVLDVPDDERRFAFGLVLDRGDQLGLGGLGGEPGDALQFLAALGILAVQLGGAPSEIGPALVQGLRAVFDAPEFFIEPLLAVGEPGFAALEITAQLTHLVLDRAYFLFDFAATLGGLLGFLAGPLENPGGLGLRASRMWSASW